jgi:hypothetical protein
MEEVAVGRIPTPWDGASISMAFRPMVFWFRSLPASPNTFRRESKRNACQKLGLNLSRKI